MEEIFRNVFGDQQLVLRDDMTANDVEGWDSLAHINLMIAVEKRFGVRFATAEISRLKGDGQTVGRLLDLVEQKKRA
jgi:acyl carrier protein